MSEAMRLLRARPESWRWYGAGLGLASGLFDAVGMQWLGVTFRLNGSNAMLLVGGYFGISFAVLGYLIGSVAAARRRDREASAIIESQLQDLRLARARLAQSEKLATLGQLAAAIAHEVRTPLAVMRSASQNLAEVVGEGSAEARKSCAFVIAEIDRLTNVVSSLLAFARPLSPKRQTARLEDMIARSLRLAEADPGAQGVHLVYRSGAAVPELSVDPDLLCQALLGLLSNAAQAAGPGGEVAVRTSSAAEGVEVAVEDTGPGVAPELRERIFEPFFTTRSQGTGLGLAVVRGIVEAHGGSLQVADREGGGARFTMRFGREVMA